MVLTSVNVAYPELYYLLLAVYINKFGKLTFTELVQHFRLQGSSHWRKNAA
jgi:hypothetical protein